MFNQQYSLDQSNSQHSSQQSQTFLAVPRLIQQEIQAYQTGVQKHVNFEDPNQLQKSEHKESLEEGDIFGSRLSIEKRNINKVDEVEENYKSLKLFQIEMQNINGRKLISKNSRKFSDQSDMGLRKHSEQLRKASSSNFPQASPKFKIQISPLLPKEDLFSQQKWPKRWFYIIKFLSKIMCVQPNLLKQSHLMLIDDKANIIFQNCFIFNPYTPKVLWIRYILLIMQMFGFLIIFWEFAFSESQNLFLAFFALSIFESLSNYFIGVYVDEMYTENRWSIAQQYVYQDIVYLTSCLLTLFVSKYFILLLLLRVQRLRLINSQVTYCFIPILLIHTVSTLYSRLSQDQFSDSNISMYVTSFQWTIFQLTNSGNPYDRQLEINGDTKIPLRVLSIIVTISGYLITIYLIKQCLGYKPQQKYKISAQLSQNLQRYQNRNKLEIIDLSGLRPDLQFQMKQELFMPLLESLPFTRSFLQDLSQTLKTQTYPNGTILHQKYQVMDKLFFLMKGNFAQCIGNKVLRTNIFPIQYFYTQLQCPLTLRCLSESLIAHVSIEEFLRLIKMHSQDFQKFCMLRDCSKEVCPCCGYRNHTLAKCKHVFYVPNFKELVLIHNTSEPNDRANYYRDNGKNRINSLQNKNLICITAISFAITNKISSETDLTNEIMGRLQGSMNNFEDSILNDFQDEKSSRYSLYQKLGTVEAPKTINSPQGTLNSLTHQQSSLPPIKLEEKESSYNSRKFVHKHVDYSHTQNSIKVNLVKSTNSNELQIKRTQKNRQTSSSSSLNKKVHSTSIMQQPKSQTGSIIPQQEENEDDIDQVCSYEYYYPSYNIENIANALNHKLMNKSISFVN
ncbi:unnamed protein product (macronuclear) [Paramecium tetraurelia]|uniref:Cyclic nucleotide-binding domain-containing protein n=1 Tax=Paramecium tetraurelia TaxID=5888 RepID=A0EH35_PARTE|nr:uncharacterized protein GSPATT00026950001 [Paramecium tetraurelia]CAK94626.1 unnamed protein product [Paramecium tetraurelia]|eukprot:XP_001461999.1 hypothetical protein (macronuclear) [Paramecium tetraurelia strain d4-2]